MGDPEGILVDDRAGEAVEDELGGGAARGAGEHLVAEAERLGHGQEREDAEEGGAFVQGFGHDAAPSPRDDAVDAPEHFG